MQSNDDRIQLSYEKMIVTILSITQKMIDSMSFIICEADDNVMLYDGEPIKVIDGQLFDAMFKNMFTALEKINHLKTLTDRPIPKKDMLRMIRIRNILAHDSEYLSQGFKYEMRVSDDGEYIQIKKSVEELYKEFMGLYCKPDNYNFIEAMSFYFENIDYGIRDA